MILLIDGVWCGRLGHAITGTFRLIDLQCRPDGTQRSVYDTATNQLEGKSDDWSDAGYSGIYRNQVVGWSGGCPIDLHLHVERFRLRLQDS